MIGLNRLGRSRSLDRAIPVAVGTPVAVAAPVAVATAAPRQGGSLLALPVISGLCCLGLILFLIAATIVLSLIPLYPSPKQVTPTTEETSGVLNATIVDDATINSGQLNAQQQAILQDELQQQLNADPQTIDAVITVQDAVAVPAAGKRKRQVIRAFIVRIAFRLFIRRGTLFRRKIFRILFSFKISKRLADLLNSAATTAAPVTTTTAAPVTTTTNSTSNRTRELVRRSLEEGGAPAGLVYVDAHQLAAMQGNVSSVSFYVDQSCGSANVEFGAFELLSRDTGKNTAELRLVKRSGVLKISEANQLKPFMTLITIHLCGKNNNNGNNVCQGHQFPVLPHQYIGVRSDSCRLGFAPVVADPVQRTTWKVADGSDPFEQVYDHLNFVPADYTILHSVIIDAPGSEKSEPVIEQKAGAASGPRMLFIGSYPPRQCGLAKFLEDLTDSYPGPHSVVAVDEESSEVKTRVYPEKVIFRLNQNDRAAYYKVADLINSEAFDVLNVQHEYALYGGMLSEYIIGMLAAVRKPIITTIHTIIPQPHSMVLSVTRALCATSTRVIVMSEMGRRLLIDVYGIDAKKISVVPHGVPDVPFSESTTEAKEKLHFDREVPTMATFGLLHRNKNVQFALKALTTVIKTIPNMMYYIIGETHPVIVSTEGESYRHELEANVTALGLSKNVQFVDKYVSDSELLEYLAATDIYLTPYAREDQYVSGTLSWAVGLGKAVVSTPYMYAKELLADGRGFLIPFEDDTALSSLIIQIVQDDQLRNEARRRAYQHGRYMTWNSVAIHIQAISRELIVDASN